MKIIFVKVYNIDMAKLSITKLKRIHSLIKNDRRKFVSLDALAHKMGIYPEVLGQELADFNPMILMDPTINLRSLLPAMEEELSKLEQEKAEKPRAKRISVSDKEVSQYRSISSFVYAKMTGAGGLVDTSAVLSDKDLRLLQKLVAAEIAKRKKPVKKSKNK